MKRGGGKNKGSGFERWVSKQLSLWWTNCERDDVFWHTHGSGGRATNRARRGRETFGQYGDIQATDPLGQPLIDVCCVELKCGYGKWSPMDAVDYLPHHKEDGQTVKQFIGQVEGDRRAGGARWGVLIVKRDRRSPIMMFPRSLYAAIRKAYRRTAPIFTHLIVRFDPLEHEGWIMVRLEAFLDWCPPEFFTERMWKPKMTRRS